MLLAAFLAAIVIVGAGALAALLWPGTGGKRPTAAVPASASGATRSAGARPASGATSSPQGALALPYRTVHHEQGYFEGTITVINRTSAPLSTWVLSFSYPGAQVRIAWGGVIDTAGSQVVIRNDPRTGSIPPGKTYTVKFGAGGVPSKPQSCRFAGRECGFTP
jgi:hypothetical protein